MSLGQERRRDTAELPVVAPGRRRARLLGGVLVGLAVLAVAYVAAAWAVTGRTASGTGVAGVDVGGLRQTAVEARLSSALSQAARRPLAVTSAGGATTTIVPDSAGLAFDPKAVAQDLTRFSLDPRRLLDHLRGGSDVAAPADAPALAAALRSVATRLDVAGKDATLSFDGATPVVTPAVPGRAVDVPAASALLRTTWLGEQRRTPIVLPATTTDPAITTPALREAVDRLVTPALSGPLTVAVGTDKAVLTPQVVATALAVQRQDDGSLDLVVDGEVLRAAVVAASPAMQERAQNARIVLSNGKPAIIASTTGKTIATPDLAAAAKAALAATEPAARTAEVSAVQTQPTFTTEQARALGIRERTSFSATDLTSNPGRTANLRLAASKINGMIVKPGETFSLNAVLGERTPERGWNKAPIIIEGRLVNDYGGGVSQMATSLFNNVFFTGLEDIEHKPHSFYIPRYPEGREATVHYPDLDLRWRNDSPYGVLIDAAIRDGQVQVGFWSTKVWDIESIKSPRTNYRPPRTIYDSGRGCIAMAGSPGFDVTVTRVFRKGGTEVRREQFKTSYNAENRVVCRARPGG